ncbi:MAG: SusC/RagA family TonB-linked outer membrane protein [Bacteroidales bacterium]|nr:SusC/RagA family TonB-linked outer membrane protein [Bacteroidales bacterium]
MNKKTFFAKLLMSLCLTLASLTLFAQTYVSGVVSGPDGLGIPGAAVLLQGTRTGVATDIDGKYSISVTGNNPVLEISCIGYVTQEIPVNRRSVINVVLEEESTLLDETLVIGYAVGNKRSISGAVEKVTADKLNKGYVADAIEALAGNVPGLLITNNGGNINGNPTVRLRGTSSLSGGNDPLVIIDGVFSNLSQLQNLSVEDLADLTVLKDASETAQYGSRGAAGVIVATTKKGGKGQFNVEYSGRFGISTIAREILPLNADQWRQLVDDICPGSGYDMGYDTEWMKWVRNDHPYQNNHNISLTHGTENFNMRASVGANLQNSLIKETYNNNYNVNFSANQKALDGRLVFDLTLRASQRNQKNIGGNVMSGALTYNPTFPGHLNEETGKWDRDPNSMMAGHPGEAFDQPTYTTGNNMQASGKVTWNILDGLQLSAFGSYGRFLTAVKSYTPTTISTSVGSATIRNIERTDMMGNIQLSYVKTFGKHEINALGLIEGQKVETFNSSMQASNFDTDKFGFNRIDAGAVVKYGNVSSSATANQLLSYMARLNYMYDSRYVLTANFRADGSSKLGANNKWGFFPSASAAWIITNEKFMKGLRYLNSLKLRIGYGVTGNQDAISAYNSLQVMNPTGITNYNGIPTVTYAIGSNANPDLKWETKATFDVGLDFAFFKSRLSGTIDYYRSRTTDMLYTYQVPVPPFVYTSLLANMGEMTNNGIELALRGDIIRTRDWTLNVSANAAYQVNELVSLHGTYNGEELTTPKYIVLASGAAGGLTSNTGVTYMTEGKPVGIFRLPVHDGFDEDAQGHLHYKVKDLDGNGVDLSDEGDREEMGQAMPKVTANMTINLRWKDFDLATQLQGAFGHKIYNFTSMCLHDLSGFPMYNVLQEAIKDNIYGLSHTSYYLENGDYVNIAYITLGYNLPASITRNSLIKGLRVALSCNNVATITGYTGLTPMINSASISGGVDARNVFPIMRTFTLQFNVKF